MHKKLLFMALAVVAVFFLFTFSRDKTITNYPSENMGVVAFGDSLVQGVGSSDGGFVTIVSKDLGIPITNLGRSGDTTADALKRVEDVVERKPKITIVLLGGNDFLRRIPEAETKANLRQIIEKIHASGSIVLLVGLGGSLEDVADEYQTAYVDDILGGILGRKSLMSDGIHPNDAGYRLMADKVKLRLKELLH